MFHAHFLHRSLFLLHVKVAWCNCLNLSISSCEIQTLSIKSLQEVFREAPAAWHGSPPLPSEFLSNLGLSIQPLRCTASAHIVLAAARANYVECVQGYEAPQFRPPHTSTLTKSPSLEMTPPTPAGRVSLLQVLHRTDTLLLRTSHLFSTPRGTDITLQTLQYLLSLLRLLLHRRLAVQLQQLTSSIADSAATALLPGETLLADFPVPLALARLARAARATKNAEELLSDYRIFARLWGLLGVYKWGRSLLAEGAAPRDAMLRWLEYAQVAANVGFQALENGAYLSQKGILVWEGWEGERGAARRARWWVWSSRFWAAHVGLEFMRLLYARTLKRREVEKARKDGNAIESGEDENIWRRNLIVNSAYAPMTLHWSFEDGLFSDVSIGICGSVAGVMGFRELWKSTALC